MVEAGNTIQELVISTILVKFNLEEAGYNAVADCRGTNHWGNLDFFGSLEHILVQSDFIINHSGAVKEFQIPNSGSGGGLGRADIAWLSVVSQNHQLFEIKPNSTNGLINARNEVTTYVNSANDFCEGAFIKGRALDFYPRYLPSRFVNTVLEITNPEPGVILYQIKPRTPETIPVPVQVPREIFEKIQDWIRRVGSKSQHLERDIAVFLKENEDLGKVLAIAAVGAAAGVVVGTIIENILTGGVGIADDAASFALAYKLVRIAQTMY